MKPNLPKSFDELIKNRYSSAGPDDLSSPVTVEELFANYYGKAATLRAEKIKMKPSLVQSLSFDDGEILAQGAGERHDLQIPTALPPFEEYVVAQSSMALQRSVAARTGRSPADQVAPFQESCVDVLQTLNDSIFPKRKPLTR